MKPATFFILCCALSLPVGAQEISTQFYKLPCPCDAALVATVGDVVVREPRDEPNYLLIRSTQKRAAASSLADQLESPQPQDWVVRPILIKANSKEQKAQIRQMRLDITNPYNRQGNYMALVNDEQIDELLTTDLTWNFIEQP